MINEMKRKFALYQLNPKNSFVYFITDENNEEPFYATAESALNLERLSGLLILYGKVGMGKTHLLQATAYEVLAENPYKDVVYATSENVVDAYKKSADRLSSRNTFQDAELLILDDIQFFKKNPLMWTEFLEILSYRSSNCKKTILSCDDSLDVIKSDIDKAWCGKTKYIKMDMPGYATRIRILEMKIRLRDLQKYHISKEVLEYLAKHASENVRILEGTLYKIIALSNISNTSIIDLSKVKIWLSE